MKIQPGLYPREQPRETSSKAELRVYEALKVQRAPNWYVWHSLRVMERDGVFGEGDFIIADRKRGLLVLEVKGGNVEQRDGRWFQNGTPTHDPRSQGYAFLRKLLSRLQRERCLPPASGVGTCFPDVEFSSPPTQDDLAQTTIGTRDLPWLRERLNWVMDHALTAHVTSRSGIRWIERIHALWGETWIPSLDLLGRSRLEDDERVKLDTEQLRVLDMVMLPGNSRLTVEGGAGTGKTLLAREAARRFADQGRRVLLLCFTNPLAQWLDRTIGRPSVLVSTLGNFALDLMRRAAIPAIEPTEKQGWEDLMLAAAVEALPKTERDWDVLIVDEGQDFADADWELLGELARDKVFWLFHDPAQRFWSDRQLPAELKTSFKIRLPEAHRCAAGIMALAEAYRDRSSVAAVDASVRRAIADKTLEIVLCPSESAVPNKIATEISKLRSAGFGTRDIGIISVRGQHAARMFDLGRLGAYRLVKADDPEAASEIVDDTFLRFKGLERPAMVVTDLNLIRDRREVRMYIAITRALDVLRIVDSSEAIKNDPVLATFL